MTGTTFFSPYFLWCVTIERHGLYGLVVRARNFTFRRLDYDGSPDIVCLSQLSPSFFWGGNQVNFRPDDKLYCRQLEASLNFETKIDIFLEHGPDAGVFPGGLDV